MKTSTKIIEQINSVLTELMTGKGISFKVDDLTDKHNTTIHIEPMRYKDNLLDGMQIIYENGVFEVSEFQAGKNQNELHIFLKTNSFRIALKNMLKGNKNRKPIEIFN